MESLVCPYIALANSTGCRISSGAVVQEGTTPGSRWHPAIRSCGRASWKGQPRLGCPWWAGERLYRALL